MTKVRRSDSGIFPSFSDSPRACNQDIHAEADAINGDLTAPNWYFETSLNLGADLQLESLFQSIPLESVQPVEMNMGKVAMETEGPVAHARPAPPPSPESSDSSYYQQNSSIPRHKRPSHKRAELKRRDKIKTRLDEVKAQVPSLADKGKMSECAVLSKAAEYTKHLLGDCERFSTEAGNLRREIESLCSEIQSVHEQLPATGLMHETVEKSQNSLDKQYKNYLAQSIKENWKFYLYSFLMKPLFQTYKEEVSTDSTEAFMASIEEWTNSRLSLSNLRHQTLEKMRDITRETDIMSNPASVPKQALASIAGLMENVTSTPLPDIGCLSALVSPAPSASSIPHLVAPATLTLSMPAHVTSLPTPVSSTPITDIAHLSAPSVAVPPTTSSHLFSSVPSALVLSSPSPSFTVPRIAAQRDLAPRLPSPVRRPAWVKEEAQERNHRMPEPTRAPRRKRASRQNCGVPEGVDESAPAARKRESLNHHAVCMPPISAADLVSLAGQESSGQQSLGAVESSDICQLAASVEETSLRMNPPIAVVTPTLPLMSPLPSSTVAHLITDSQYHEYDFDLADIPPLPDL